MHEIEGNIWDYHKNDDWVVVTTNGDVNRNKEAVMGRGIAKQAAEKFPDLKKELGYTLLIKGNNVYLFPDYRIITFPVKRHWSEKASLDLIYKSCKQLSKILSDGEIPYDEAVYMVRPGCGNGNLSWNVVKPIVENTLGEMVTIVEWENN